MKKSTQSQKKSNWKPLLAAAKKARAKAYAPYSNYQVGAAVRLKNGSIFSGCNVENSTYGATTCAEQVAVFNAVSECGKIQIEEAVILTESSPPAAPCGICRQVLAEFGPKMTLHLVNPKGEQLTLSLAEIFPAVFTPAHLGVKV